MNRPTSSAALLAALLCFPATLLEAESLLLKNADIETMTGRGRLDATDLLIADGRIERMGKNLSAPEARQVDASGKRLTPGVFNAYTHMGVVEIGGISETRDYIAAILHRAGVVLLFTGMGWQNTHNAFLVTQSAGNAVANGLPYQAALQAIFSNPAEVFQLSGAGRIEVGAVADLVLWNNDPLELLREAELVFVNGVEVPLVSRSTRLRDRYFQRLKTQP